jgi:hypothetical protein
MFQICAARFDAQLGLENLPMFCNTPGTGADDRALITNTIALESSDGDLDHADHSWGDEPLPVDISCKKGICQTDWKPQRDEQA